MLEHADRDNTVKTLVHVPIVLQQESRVAAHALFRSALVSNGVLLLGKSDTGDVGAAKLGEVQAQAAPAASDVEYALVGNQFEFCRDVPFLRKLRVVERAIRRFEIGAAVLAVCVKE